MTEIQIVHDGYARLEQLRTDCNALRTKSELLARLVQEREYWERYRDDTPRRVSKVADQRRQMVELAIKTVNAIAQSKNISSDKISAVPSLKASDTSERPNVQVVIPSSHDELSKNIEPPKRVRSRKSD